MNDEVNLLHGLFPSLTSDGLDHAYIDDTEYVNFGMVYGIDFGPSGDNPSFQVASKAIIEDIKIPMFRSLIARAITNRNDPSVFVNNELTSSQFKCKNPSYHMDRYGY